MEGGEKFQIVSSPCYDRVPSRGMEKRFLAGCYAVGMKYDLRCLSLQDGKDTPYILFLYQKKGK